MALLLIGLIAIGLVASLFFREVRVFLLLLIAAIAGVILLYVAVDVARSFRDIHRENVAMSRIPPADVLVDDLQLTGTSAAGYRLGGTVHNHNASYALTDVRFNLVLEDCTPAGCRQEATGHAEAIRLVPPNQAATFSTQIVSLPPLQPPLGQRRITAQVFTTVGLP